MNYETQGFLDRADQTLLNCHVDRALSEAAFLWHILRDLGEDRLASVLSPVMLFRRAKIGWPQGEGSPFLIVALPSQSPRIPCLAGDWMVRAAPGTGDVGHISLLVSGDLSPRSALEAEGILAEGNQPGFYGIVIESGAFPHRRDETFARRILDSHGRLPADTIVLRPSVFVAETQEETRSFDAPKGRQRGPPRVRDPCEDFEGTEAQWAPARKTLIRRSGAPATLVGESLERDPAEGTEDFSTWQPWEIAVFRALLEGERRLETLRKMARDRGASAAAIQSFLQNYVKVPFPPVPQSGGVDCEKQLLAVAPASPEARAGRFTGRYESRNAEGKRYFWAINQAGSAVIAVRTTRFCHENEIKSGVARYWKLRGTIRPDGSAVMFADNEPEQFWGYLEPFGTLRSFRWRSWSFRDSYGNRVVVRESPKLDETTWTWDETLTPMAELRPTMMESLWSLADARVSVLLKQHEWWPLTNEQYDFLSDGAQSDLLRILLTTYFDMPEGITYTEKEAKRTAGAQVAAFVECLLWDGTAGTRPDMPANQSRLVQFADEARRKVPQGHCVNDALAIHVAKIYLVIQKLDHREEKRTLLDWLAALAQERQQEKSGQNIARILGLKLDSSRASGAARYRITLTMVQLTAGLGYGEGTLTVTKLTKPLWQPQTMRYNVTQIGVGTVSLPSRDRLFDQVVETPQEWAPGDFEGTLWFGETSASADAGVAGAGASLRGSYLHSDSGLLLSLEGADADTHVSGLKKPHKPKLSFGGKLLAGRVSRENSGVVDLSRPYSSLAVVGGNLRAATHFCFGSSLLTPAGRELLRLVCADQLAVLSDPSCHIAVIGEADRPDKHQVNTKLSQLRADNVKTALLDILGDEIRDLPDRITALGVGAWPARLQGHADALRNASDRQVSVFVNGTLVVQFRGALSAP